MKKWNVTVTNKTGIQEIQRDQHASGLMNCDLTVDS